VHWAACAASASACANLDSRDVRAVGTNTFRAADNASEFLGQAEQALGHLIDIISGVEEARLIYNGVAHSLKKADERRLVVDIGGGSIELILPSDWLDFHPLTRADLLTEAEYLSTIGYSLTVSSKQMP
jgi:exopolyphosphatase/pppGpp-phosphohydrolase